MGTVLGTPWPGFRPGPAAQWPSRPDRRGALVRVITACCAAAVARPVRAHRWMRYGGGGGASTMGAAATRLIRWWWRGHTGGRRQWVGGPAAPVNHGEGKGWVQSA
jgi:hypothetical protein